jgi:hypothetical protein
MIKDKLKKNTMFQFNVKSNISKYEQIIKINKMNNLSFNNSDLIHNNYIVIGIEQLLDSIYNGNYYMYEILLVLYRNNYDDDIKKKNFVNLLIKISAYIIKIDSLCDNMIYYIQNEENNYIKYTLWKLIYIISGKHNPFQIDSHKIDFEIKNNSSNVIQLKNLIFYSYSKYKKYKNTFIKNEYQSIKPLFLNYFE